MIFPETPSRALLQILLNRTQNMEKAMEVDYHLVEFGDVRYHIQASISDPQHMEISISIPPPPLETIFSGGLPFGALEAVKGAYGATVQIVDPPEEGFQLTLKLDLAKLPSDEENRIQLMTKVASLRAVVLGAPMREILKHLASKAVEPDADQLVALVHRPKESFFLIPMLEKVTVVFPLHFRDSIDALLATSFLQEFMEARHTTGLNKAPPCLWSPTPPLELKGAPVHALDANAGFVSFVLLPHHVEGDKLDRTVWSLSSFYAYINYHIKCSKGVMHTRMRRRVESLIQALNQTKLDAKKEKKTVQGLRCVQKLWRRPKPQTPSIVGGHRIRQVSKISVPIQIQRVKQYQTPHVWGRCLKIPKISSLRQRAR